MPSIKVQPFGGAEPDDDEDERSQPMTRSLQAVPHDKAQPFGAPDSDDDEDDFDAEVSRANLPGGLDDDDDSPLRSQPSTRPAPVALPGRATVVEEHEAPGVPDKIDAKPDRRPRRAPSPMYFVSMGSSSRAPSPGRGPSPTRGPSPRVPSPARSAPSPHLGRHDRQEAFYHSSENDRRRAEKRALRKGRNGVLSLISAQLENPTKGNRGHWLIDSRPFLGAVYLAICANALQMGLCLDLVGGGWDRVWTVLDHAFTAFFLLEMLTKIAVLKPFGYEYIKDKANLFDGALVTLAVVDNWVLPAIIGGGDSPLSQFAMFRLLRLARLARLFRLLKVFKELWMILKGIIASFKALFWVCILLAILLYIAGIVCVDMIGKKGESMYPGTKHHGHEFRAELTGEFDAKLYFGSLSRSMYTLFSLAIMAEWVEFGRPMLEVRPHMLAGFLVFIIFTNFGLMNVIVSVIVETTMESSRSLAEAAADADTKTKLCVLEKIRDTVWELDEDGSGTLSVDELMAGASRPEVMKLFEMVNLPTGFSPQSLMDLLDMDGNREMSNDEFMKGFYRLISSDTFQTTCNTTVILNQLRKEVMDTDAQISQAVREVTEKLERVEVLAARAVAAKMAERPETSLR